MCHILDNDCVQCCQDVSKRNSITNVRELEEMLAITTQTAAVDHTHCGNHLIDIYLEYVVCCSSCQVFSFLSNKLFLVLTIFYKEAYLAYMSSCLR